MIGDLKHLQSGFAGISSDMASHFENLLVEYYRWLGLIVYHNQKVGRRALGGWEMELDIVAYDPQKEKIIHIEPSLDANTWERRIQRFQKKFEIGRRYLHEKFPWLPPETPIEQVAVFIQAGPNHRTIAGASVRTVDEMIAEIRDRVHQEGRVSKAAIPEQFPMLRTIQYVVRGYYKVC